MFVKNSLRTLKLRRLFKGLLQFTQWQKQWMEHVRKNFLKQKLKSSFRDLYLNALL